MRNILGGFKKALRRFSAEPPKIDSDTCLGRLSSGLGHPSGCISDFRAVTLTDMGRNYLLKVSSGVLPVFLKMVKKSIPHML